MKQSEAPARLLWTSSLEAQPRWYDHADWQLLKTDHPYEASKYQIDLVASELQRRSLQPGGEANVVRHIIVHPGVVWSNMSKDMVWAIFNVFIGLIFYIVSHCHWIIRLAPCMLTLSRVDG